MPVTEPIRNKQHIRQIMEYYQKKGNLRNCLLVVMGIHTALRVSDLLRLTWGDVYDFESGKPQSHIYIIEGKTKKPKAIALNPKVIAALADYRAALTACFPSSPLFPNNRKGNKAISRFQAYRIIRAAAESCNVPGRVSCHSLRKTFGYHAWKSGQPVVVLMEIYNHSSFEVTRRYLGVAQDDKDKVYLGLDFY